MDTVLLMFLQLILLTLLSPYLKPLLFLLLSISSYSLIIGILAYRDALSFAIDGVYLYIHIIYFIILITKILLYNGKVRYFVLTENLEKEVERKTKKIVELKNVVMETIAEMVERRDESTGEHINRTSRYLKIFIDSIIENGLFKKQTASWDIEQIILSAQLHDVGKIAIDDSILRKHGKLDDNEFEIMKKHTILGGEIIKNIQKKTGENEYLYYANIFAVYHHEKWDGSGYPYKISGEDIPLLAHIMAIIDVYDALVSERPYKKAFPHDEAMEIINNPRCKQRGIFVGEEIYYTLPRASGFLGPYL